MRTWEELSKREQLEAIWWDLYKDVNGFRPRGIDTSDWSIEQFESELDSLGKALEQVIEQEEEAQKFAIEKFEERVQRTIELGAGERQTALLWIMEAEEANGDFEYLAYKLNLPYTYFDNV